MKILLIEDDMHIAKFLLNGFQKEGIQVTHAPTGVDGLHEATEESYDLIVLDLMLPLKNGYDVLESLRGEGIQHGYYFKCKTLSQRKGHRLTVGGR